MIPIASSLENKVFSLYELEKQLKPLGYVVGGNWDYDEGCFDYQMADQGGYEYLRIPFKVESGMLDAPGATVRLGSPFVLAHIYQGGVENHADNGALQGMVNQFQSPVDPDAKVPDKYVNRGKKLVQQLEHLLV
ncbi:YugN-like family protein [Radiobacillus kanasensis]|uniref:YugN-like family protein n=1 Tax=Radiobacillus kanasensis TaxID=2844358 RepID=UPI001E523C3D|nr:YugN-like family protein [Radiobacillus kanasensis]UFT98194.1 YugN-like family protein [Radiobacillus kanasensis]